MDFVCGYAQSGTSRLHMPGHKGQSLLGFEPLDLTEIRGADELYEPEGIIAQSEANATRLFGTQHTYYSTEGSSQCIRAMLCLALQAAPRAGKRPVLLAARNAHKALLYAAALLDFDIRWLWPAAENAGALCSCPISAQMLTTALQELTGQGSTPFGVYVTSPDYLGGVQDIPALAAVCRAQGVPLLVDNAHGAYLRFLPQNCHPIAQGAAMCCDSAHKTLPVVTGGAYLHISDSAPKIFAEKAKTAMSVFGSSSPSYLILQSLDAANSHMSEYAAALGKALPIFDEIRREIRKHGIEIMGGEPLKITLAPKSFGYDGRETAELLQANNIYAEYCDSDFTVLMLSPLDTDSARRCAEVLCSLRRRASKTVGEPPLCIPDSSMTVREAMFSPNELLPTDRCVGRVCAASVISCPPAIPIVVCGEIIDDKTAACLKYYGIEKCAVVSGKAAL